MLLPVSLFRLCLLLPLAGAAHRYSSIRIAPFLTESLFFLIMGAVIFFSNRWGTGYWTPGILKTARFFFILWSALIFTYTTDPLSISGGVYRILKYIPLLPARHISTILGLSLTMIPLVIDEIREIREAMLSRCSANRINPLRKMIHLGIPLMEGILLKAEHLSDAMESRLFTEEATPPESVSSSTDRYIFLLFLLIITLIILLEKVVFSHAGTFFLFKTY